MYDTLDEILTCCKIGEDDAVKALVNRFHRQSVDLAYAILADRDLAEDAVQEAFLAALSHLPDLRENYAFPAWFRQIVRTYALRILRARRETLLTAELPETADHPAGRTLEQEELRRKVREALQSLSPAGRQTAELFYIDEMSCSDIAGILQVPEGTIKRRLHDARKQMRSMLLGYIGDENEK